MSIVTLLRVPKLQQSKQEAQQDLSHGSLEMDVAHLQCYNDITDLCDKNRKSPPTPFQQVLHYPFFLAPTLYISLSR